jgi:hypothetical protein
MVLYLGAFLNGRSCTLLHNGMCYAPSPLQIQNMSEVSAARGHNARRVAHAEPQLNAKSKDVQGDTDPIS